MMLTQISTLDNAGQNNLTGAPIISETIITQDTPQPKEYKSFFKTIASSHASLCAYQTRIDTYGCGCSHNCDYCYARGQLEFRKQWFPKNPSIADIGKIKRKIKTLPAGFVVRMGGMTDCFQRLELDQKVSLETIKALNEQKVGYLIVTKSPIVAYPYYLDVLDKELAHVQITVTSLDPELSKRYEKAYPPDQRIKAILTLQEKGYDVAIRLSPLLEVHMDFDKLNSLGINKCVVEFLRYNGWIKEWFARESYENLDKYTHIHGNYRHLPLDEKLRIISKVKIPSITVCEKVPEHYEFWKTHFNPNPADCCNLRIRGTEDSAN